MKDASNLEKYTPEWDSVYNAELEIVKGAYPSIWSEYQFSVKVPNMMSGMYLHSLWDGDQPSYDPDMCQLAENLGLDYESVADYPRHDNTLRLGFKSIKDAVKYLTALSMEVADYGTN